MNKEKLKIWIGRLLCLFGWHDWEKTLITSFFTTTPLEVCRRCGSGQQTHIIGGYTLNFTAREVGEILSDFGIPGDGEKEA